MFAEKKKPDVHQPEAEPRLDEVVEDLSIDEDDAEAVMGGTLGRNPGDQGRGSWAF